MNPAEYEIMFRAEETHWWYRALHQLILGALERELSGWRAKAILDAGCGTGAILQRLGHPEKNRGIDLAPEAISFCRARGLANAQEGDVGKLPFADASFDAVICSSVLCSRRVEVGSALRELHRVLRPDGLLLLNLPAFGFLHSAHDVAVMTARRFTKGQIETLLREHGFAIQQSTYWTAFLFPLAVLARTLGGSKLGRDFPGEGKLYQFTNPLFTMITRWEVALLKKGISLPFGVALFAVARKQDVVSRGRR
jgi:SAM-dependent methyltransferase